MIIELCDKYQICVIHTADIIYCVLPLFHWLLELILSQTAGCGRLLALCLCLLCVFVFSQ